MPEPTLPTREPRRPAPPGQRKDGARVQRLRAWFVRMSFRTKFLVVGGLVAGPLCALAGFAAAQFHAQVTISQSRTEALTRAAAARDLIEALALHRGLTASVLAGGEGLSSRLVQQQAVVEQALARLLALLPDDGDSRSDMPEPLVLATEVRALKAMPDALDPTRNFERHNRVIDRLVVLMHRAGTRGAASNGPHLAGAYDLAFVALPELVEALGRQRGWGSAVLQQEQFSAGELTRHLMFAGAVARHLELLEADPRSFADLDRLTTAEGAPAGAVAEGLRAAVAEVEVFSQRSIALLLGRRGGGEVAQQHFTEGTVAIDRLLAASRVLTALLQTRTEAQQSRAERLRATSLAALLLVVLSLALVYREFERSTVQRLQRLTLASARLADGAFDDTVSVEGSDEIASLAEAFDAMRRRLRKAVDDSASALAAHESERARTEFLARWSHDLRTPLAAVLGFARLLSERDAGLLTASQQADLQRIQTAAEHLLHLVDDVLAISSGGLHEAPLKLLPLDLAGVARAAITLNQPEADRRGIGIRCALDGLAPVQADRTRLLQVLGNLIGNAIKFNHADGWVELRGERDGETLRLDVVDSGPGIAPELLTRLFMPFERLDADARNVPGTGLGLVTSKRLIEAMHGRIAVASRPGMGTTFSLWLPLAVADAAGAADAATRDDGPPRVSGRVAYVEDNETNVELMRAMMSMRMAVVLTVFIDGASALASDEPFDLWIIDRQLPDSDGVALLQALRQRRGNAVLAVLFTADALPQHRDEALAAGFAECWTKPIEIAALEQSLRGLLRPR